MNEPLSQLCKSFFRNGKVKGVTAVDMGSSSIQSIQQSMTIGHLMYKCNEGMVYAWP